LIPEVQMLGFYQRMQQINELIRKSTNHMTLIKV